MMLKIFTLAAVVAVASAQFTSGGTMTINGVVQKPDADGVTRLGVTKDAEEGSGDGTAVVDVKAQLEAGIKAAKAAMKAAKCDGARARREVDCVGAGAIECSKCACLQTPASPCSTEDSTWCMANLATGNNCIQYQICVAVPTPIIPYQATDCNGIGAVECSKCICLRVPTGCSTEDRTWCDANLMTGNNCIQYSICPQDAAAGNTGGGGGDGDKAVVAENTVTVEVKTLQITIKADVDLSKLNAADLKKFADAGKAMALAAGVPADQIKDIKYFQEVLNADGTSKDPKELKEIKAPTSRRARRALFFGPITFEIVFKDTATVDLANLAEKVNVAIVQGNVPFTVELSTGKLTGKVNKAEMVVVEVKDDGIVVPVSGSSTTAFAAGLIATLAAVATIV